MSSTAENVCPKCGATEIKNLSWIVTLGAVLFCVNGLVQLILGFVFFQGAPFWTQVNSAVTNVVWGIEFWLFGWFLESRGWSSAAAVSVKRDSNHRRKTTMILEAGA